METTNAIPSEGDIYKMVLDKNYSPDDGQIYWDMAEIGKQVRGRMLSRLEDKDNANNDLHLKIINLTQEVEKLKDQSAHWRKCYNMELENYGSLKEQFHIHNSELEAVKIDKEKYFELWTSLEESYSHCMSKHEELKSHADNMAEALNEMIYEFEGATGMAEEESSCHAIIKLAEKALSSYKLTIKP